jgi:hypothetical protein
VQQVNAFRGQVSVRSSDSSPYLEIASDHIGRAPADDDMTEAFSRFEPEPENPAPQESVASGSQVRALPVSSTPRIGRYELLGKLAQGTFGMVQTARDTALERDVALKIMNRSHRGGVSADSMLGAARLIARIGHPGIATMLDCDKVTTNGEEIAFIAIERLQGESLAARLARSGALPPITAAEIVRQVASALDAAHRANVVHGDLVPDNIFLVADPAMLSGERVKVLDFGLAKLASTAGTPRYMSPEQCHSPTALDERSDVYALGCILFELVTGRTPFEGEVYKILDRHQRAIPPRALALAAEVSVELDGLIAQMLAKNPTDRPTMAAVQRELQHAGAVSPGVEATMLPETFARALGAAHAELRWEPAEPDYVADVITEKTDPPPFGVTLQRQRERRRRSWIAPVAAIAIAVALAVVLSMLGARDKNDVATPAAPGSVRG